MQHSNKILVCLNDLDVMDAVIRGLDAKGFESVLKAEPEELVTTLDQGCSLLVLQDDYASGENGASMLRRSRIALGTTIPSVFVLTSDLPDEERHVLERQYDVRAFHASDASADDLVGCISRALSEDYRQEQNPDTPDPENDDSPLYSIDFDASLPDFPSLDSSFEDGGDSGDAVFDRTQKIVRTDSQRPHTESKRPREQALEADVSPKQSATELDGTMSIEDLDDDALFMDDDEKSAVQQEDEPPQPEESSSAKDHPQNSTTEVYAASVFNSDDDLFEEDDSQLDNVALNKSLAESQLDRPPMTDIAAGHTRLDQSESSDASSSDSESMDNQADALSEEEEMKIKEMQEALDQKQIDLSQALQQIEALENDIATMKSDQSPDQSALPNEGMLEETRYPELLSFFRSQGLSGSLEIALQVGTTRTVFVKDGSPVAHTTSEPGERIGKVLVTQGRISDEQYVKAATRMVERGISLSDALVELRLVDSQTLERETRNLILDEIISLFSISQGKFKVSMDTEPPKNASLFDFSPGEIFLRGYQEYAPSQEMNALYERLRPEYLRSNNKMERFRNQLGLSGDHERLLRYLGEAYTFEEAVEQANLEGEKAARLLATLQALELVEPWSPDAQAFQKRLQEERKRHAEDVAKIQQEAAQREQSLVDGFEQALAKIASAVEKSQTAPRDIAPEGRSQGRSASAPSETMVLPDDDPEPETPSSAAPSHTVEKEPEAPALDMQEDQDASDAVIEESSSAAKNPFAANQDEQLLDETDNVDEYDHMSDLEAQADLAEQGSGEPEEEKPKDEMSTNDLDMVEEEADSPLEISAELVSSQDTESIDEVINDLVEPASDIDDAIQSQIENSDDDTNLLSAAAFEELESNLDSMIEQSEPSLDHESNVEDAIESSLEDENSPSVTSSNAIDAILNADENAEGLDIGVGHDLSDFGLAEFPDEEIQLDGRAKWLEGLPKTESLDADGSYLDKKFYEGVKSAHSGDLGKAEALLREAVRSDSSGAATDKVILGLVSLGRVLLGNSQYDEVATIPIVNGLLKKASSLNESDAELMRFKQEIADRFPE